MTVGSQATIPKSSREHVGLQPSNRRKSFVHPQCGVAGVAIGNFFE
jgi:hypothetical protein